MAMVMNKIAKHTGLALFLMIGLFPAILLEAQQKLVFKDGSIEKVERYNVKGDRVRFKSVERSEWEEVPLDQVDLKTTEELNKKEAEELKKLPHRPLDAPGTKSEGATAGGKQNERPVEVSPGVKLPDAYGLYVWDGQSLVTITEAGTRQRSDRKNAIINIISPAPLMKQRISIQLDGVTSDTRLHNPIPIFYAHFPEERGGNLSLFRMMITKTARVLKEVSHSQITGSDSVKTQEFIFTPSIRVADNVFKMFPTKPLTEGEYCLVEMTQQQNQINTTVWDFTIVK